MITFKDLGINNSYIKALKELQIKNPTAIQEKTIGIPSPPRNPVLAGLISSIKSIDGP